MPTSAIGGYTGRILAGASTGTAISIAEFRTFEITQEMSEIDATSRDSSGHREHIAGIRNWSGTMEYLYAGSNASQIALKSLLNGGTLVAFEFYPAGSSASFPIYTGSGYINDWSATVANEDAIAVNVGFVGTGALTQTTA